MIFNIYVMNKICNVCNVEKDISNFSKRKDSKDGYRNICKSCNMQKRTGYFKEYYLTNKDKNKEYYKKHSKEYWEQNKNILKIKRKPYMKEYMEKNKDKRKEYIKENSLKIKQQEKIYKEVYKNKRNECRRDRYATDTLYRLTCIYRRITNQVFKKKGYKKNYSCEKLLGCSYNDYLIYIESKFDKWMTHDNFGLYNGTYNYGWDIDHIKPLSKAITEEDIIKLCHYTNLQPLCSKINRDIKKAN